MSEQKVPNHLVFAILITIFCCLPLGIVSIVQAAKVNGLVAGGDMDGALAASASAKKWATWGLVIGLVVNILVIVMQVVVAMAAA